MSAPDELDESPLPGTEEPPEEAEFDAKLQAASPGAGLRALVGLAVIWGALYLVALANQISDNRRHSHEPSPAGPTSPRGTGPVSPAVVPGDSGKESEPSAQSRKAPGRVLSIAAVGSDLAIPPAYATPHESPRSLRP